MKKALLFVAALCFGVGVIVPASYAAGGFFSLKAQGEVEPFTDEVYVEECGSCHFPYQAGLLPEASWRKLLTAKALSDHFGDNAELDDDVRTDILNKLVKSSADKSTYKRSRKLMSSLRNGEVPARITEVPYIKSAHHDVPQKLIKDNPKVKSLSQCNKCHRKAEEGIFDDDTVMIPGHGYWTW